MVKLKTIYSMSFSTGALFQQQSVMLAGLYANLGDWQFVRSKVLGNNLLQARTKNTAHRICREVISRLKRLTPDQLSALVECTAVDHGHILWAAVCKRYQFICDFALEVVHEKFLSMDLLLTQEDYNVYFNQKAEWHDEVSRVKEATKRKLRQVIFRMLHEAGLLSGQKMIIPIVLSPMVQSAILDDPDLTLSIYPVEDRKA
jgi:hypothetical protein